MTKQTEDEGLTEVMNRKPAFGEATQSAQLSLIEELASYVGARERRPHQNGVDPPGPFENLLTRLMILTLLDLFDEIEATVLDDSIKSEAQIIQCIEQIVSEHRKKAAQVIRSSMINELEALLEALDNRAAQAAHSYPTDTLMFF